MANIWDKYPQVYHYTTLPGLRGILETQTLWATHYQSLNDLVEIEIMRATLEGSLLPLALDRVKKFAKDRFSYKLAIDKDGGNFNCAKRIVSELVGMFYDVTFRGLEDMPPIAPPFITSFCYHAPDSYEHTNGLLSMWRSYGDAGYAIVFDTKRLYELLCAERDHYWYSGFVMGSVVYEGGEQDFDGFDEVRAQLEREFDFLLRREMQVKERDTRDTLQKLFEVVPRFKHQGFKEENEVRLAVAPVPEDYLPPAERYKGENRVKGYKPILKRGSNEAIPYIVLNDHPGRKRTLPIRRIIVGPQRNQQERLREVASLIGDRSIDILGSDTPYLPGR